MKLKQVHIDDLASLDLRPAFGLRGAFEDFFDPPIRPVEGTDGLDHFTAAEALVSGEPVMFLRYRGFPKNRLSFYVRHGLDAEEKRRILEGIVDGAGLGPDVIE